MLDCFSHIRIWTDDSLGWGRTTVDVTDDGSTGFVIDSEGHLVNVNPHLGFKGWRICRWVSATGAESSATPMLTLLY